MNKPGWWTLTKWDRLESKYAAWAELLYCVFGVRVWVCDPCGDHMNIRVVVVGNYAVSHMNKDFVWALAHPKYSCVII